jgi:hypothetical protein
MQTLEPTFDRLGSSFAWVLNLDAELELARPSYQPKVRVLSQLARYGADSRALLGPGDVLLEPETRPEGPLIGRAWCPTPRALAAFAAAGIEAEPHPTLAVLRQVNHRLFAHELGGGLPDQHYVLERGAVEAILSRGGQWMLKRPLTLAGRGQLRAFRELSAKEWSWVDASLAHDGLIVEPLVTPTLELSQHGFVWPNGTFELGRACVQEVTHRGVFRGIRLAAGELGVDEIRALAATSERVAAALAGAGYFGPFGVDAYRYERGGTSGFCPLGEINARYTMGFAVGFPRPAHELALA